MSMVTASYQADNRSSILHTRSRNIAILAQLVEQLICNEKVRSSILRSGTKKV